MQALWARAPALTLTPARSAFLLRSLTRAKPGRNCSGAREPSRRIFQCLLSSRIFHLALIYVGLDKWADAFRFARLLYREGDIDQAYTMAKLALACKPLDKRNKDLVEELKKRISESAKPASA